MTDAAHRHLFAPYDTAPLQEACASWSVAYCRCGARESRVLNPLDNKPITTEQPK